MRRTGQAWLLAAAIGCAGCAEIRLRTTPEILSETSLPPHKATLAVPAITTRVEEGSGRITLVAERPCAVHQVHDVRRTVRYSHYDANKKATTRLGIAGGVITAAGGVLTALPAMPVHTDHTSDLAIGIPTVALGVALATAAISGAAQAAERETTFETVTVDDGEVQPNVPCGTLSHAVADEPVVGRLEGERPSTLSLGTTDREGRVDIDMEKLSAALKGAPDQDKLAVFIQQRKVGEMSVGALRLKVEEGAWSRTDVATCRTSLVCVSLEEFVRRFPDGRHAAEAREILDRTAVLIRERVEREVADAAVRAKAQARVRAAEERKKAAVQAASLAARRAAASICAATCRARCNGDAACTGNCVDKSCERAFLFDFTR